MPLMNVFKFKESDRNATSNGSPVDQERATMVGSPLFQSLSEDLQEQSFLNPHLWTYLEGLDPETIGIPEFVPRLSKNLRSDSSNNFIYPVANRVFIHLYSSDGEARDHYIAIEPASSVMKSGLMVLLNTSRLLMSLDSFMKLHVFCGRGGNCTYLQ